MSRRLALLLFVLGVLAGAASLRTGVGFHDEGLMLQWGARIRAGEWPYRDFWSNYLPGQTMLQALLGPSLLAWRVLRVCTGAAAAVVVFALVDREAGERRWAVAAWLAAALTVAWPLTPGPTVSAAFLALLALLVAPKGGGRTGVLAGLAFLFRPEIGVAAMLGALVVQSGRRDRQVRSVACAALLSLLALAPFVAVAGSDFFAQTFGFARLQHLQRLPLVVDPGTADPNKILERMLPLLLVIGSVLWIGQALWTRRNRELIPLVGVGLLYLVARADEFHVVPLTVALALAAGVAAGSTSQRLLPVLLLGLVALAGADRIVGAALDARGAVPIGLPRADGVRADPRTADSLRGLSEIVRARTQPGDPILVLPPRVDRVRFGAPLLYPLLDRTNPTRYDVMQPGVVTTAAVQREMLRDLNRAQPRVIVRWLSHQALQTEPNGSARSSGVRELDRVIERRYRPLTQVGDWLVLVPS